MKKTSFAAHSALRLIRVYQRHLSPRKGYGCAYRLLHGGSGCSGVGCRLIRRYGLLSGYGLLRRRFAHCRAAGEILYQRRRGLAYYQRGDCDCSPICVDVDIPHCHNSRFGWRWLLEILDFCSCCEFVDCSGHKDDESKKKTV